MNRGDRVTFRPEAWERYQREIGTTDLAPSGVTVIHVASERTTLRGYVYLGLPWSWQKIEDLCLA